MTTKIKEFNNLQLKNKDLDVRPGDKIKVHEKISYTVSDKGSKKGAKKETVTRTQVFEGLVIAKKHGKGISSTITVRKVISGVGVEKIFPIHSPLVEKIEIISRGRVRRAKLSYLREAKGRKSRLKRKELNLIEETQNSAELPEEKMADTTPDQETAPEEKKEQDVSQESNPTTV